MRIRIAALLIVGAMFAVLAGFGSFSYMRALEAELAATRATVQAIGETTRLPVPKQDVARGTALTPDRIDWIALPAGRLPADILHSLPTPSRDGTIVAMTDLKAGALLTRRDLSDTGTEASHGYLLSQDGRAIAVHADNLEDMRDGLTPGSLVDLFWTRDIGGGGTETRLLASGLTVVSVPGRTPEAPVAAAPAVVAPTTERQAKLVLSGRAEDAALYLEAQKRGRFHVVPANSAREITNGQIVVGPADLAGLPIAVAAPQAAADGAPLGGIGSAVARLNPGAERRTCSTAVIRAANRIMMEVPC